MSTFAPKKQKCHIVMEHLTATYRKLLHDTTTVFHRYMYDRINWSNRMFGIVGPRGVGKTTMLLQHIKEQLDAGKADAWCEP